MVRNRKFAAGKNAASAALLNAAHAPDSLLRTQGPAREISAAANKPTGVTHRRTEALTPGKIASLTPQQRASLKTWLVKEKLGYVATRLRLLEKFGLAVSSTTISKFWHHHCVGPLERHDSEILLDVMIVASGPCRLVVRRRGYGVRILKGKAK